MVIALFPGQGSQHVGMGKSLYENFSVAREAFEEASDAVKLNLKKLCFDGPDADLTLTENTQPCLLTVSVAAFRAAQKETGLKPTLVAGHSLGEYSALVAAGALRLDVAARWVRERGAAMQRAVPVGQGTMAAVMGLSDEAVDQLCARATEDARSKRSSRTGEDLIVDAIVQPANYNSPGQTVIAGSVDAVEEALSLIKSGAFPGGKAIALSVSAPFHCRLMEPARTRMAEIFHAASATDRPKSPDVPYLPNRTARISREPGIILDLLVEQIDHPVLWKQSILTALGSGVTSGYEFGPGKVLQGLAKRIAKDTQKELPVLSVGDAESLKEIHI